MLTSPCRPVPSCAVVLLYLALTACGQGGRAEEDLDYHRGRNAMAMARYDWARFYFAADLEAHPDRPESLRGLGLGWVSGYQGSLTHGIEALEAYLALVPEDTEMRLRLAGSWLRAGQPERAAGVLADIEDSLDAELLRARILLASDPQAARRPLEAALEAAPDDFEARFLAAQVHARLGEDGQALAQAQRAAEIDPSSAELFYLMAQILRRQGDLEASAEALATFELVNRLAGPGAPADARQELAVLRQVADRMAPSSMAFKRRLARLLLETGATAEAMPLLDEILAVEDTDAETLLVLAQAAHTQGKISIARDFYQQALERQPDHPKALAQLALLAYETQDFATAQGLLDRGLELDPHQAPLHFTAGLLALARGQGGDAIQALRRAVDLVPWLARYRITLADVYLTRGEREAFDQLLAETPAPDAAVDAYRKKHP